MESLITFRSEAQTKHLLTLYKHNELVHDWKKEDDEEIDYEDENVARTANRYCLKIFNRLAFAH